MGLREEKAEQTRELIVSTALRLFSTFGYDSTTIEEVAESARVGMSTVYRYFPSKDLLVLDPLALSGHMAAQFSSRPADEPTDLALGHALRAVIIGPRADAERVRQITAILDGSLALRSQLAESLNNERALLEDALADRLGRPRKDPHCVFSARVAMTILELIAERAHEYADDLAEDPARVVEMARVMMDELRREPPMLPRLGSVE